MCWHVNAEGWHPQRAEQAWQECLESVSEPFWEHGEMKFPCIRTTSTMPSLDSFEKADYKLLNKERSKLLGSGEDQLQSGSASSHTWSQSDPTQCRSRSRRVCPNRRLRTKTRASRPSLRRMMQPSAHSDAHITPRSAHTPDAHTPMKKPAKSDRSRIMSDRPARRRCGARLDVRCGFCATP